MTNMRYAPAVLKIGFPYFENKSNTVIFSFLVLKKVACTLFQVIAERSYKRWREQNWLSPKWEQWRANQKSTIVAKKWKQSYLFRRHRQQATKTVFLIFPSRKQITPAKLSASNIDIWWFDIYHLFSFGNPIKVIWPLKKLCWWLQ